MEKMDRRVLLRNSALFTVGTMAAGLARAQGIITPPQAEGPFYPVTDQLDKDADLTQVQGHTRRALGEHVMVTGKVTNNDGTAVEGALVDVWQACASGRYSHPRDTNTAPLDADFQYWARMLTGKDGTFSFRTVIPGAYPADTDRMRPPHIHFRVDGWNRKRLTTQMYFAEFPELNAKDQILQDTVQRYGRDAAKTLVIEFKERVGAAKLRTGVFNIILGSTPHVD